MDALLGGQRVLSSFDYGRPFLARSSQRIPIHVERQMILERKEQVMFGYLRDVMKKIIKFGPAESISRNKCTETHRVLVDTYIIEMARNQRRSAPSRAAPSRPASTTSSPPVAQHQQSHPVAPMQQQQKQPGLFAQMATTAAGVAVGSAVGHTLGAGLSGMFGGSGHQNQPQEVQQQAPAQQQNQQQNNACETDQRAFMKCLDSNQNDIGACENAMTDSGVYVGKDLAKVVDGSKAVSNLVSHIIAATSSEFRHASANDLKELIHEGGCDLVHKSQIIDSLRTHLNNQKQPAAREGALVIITSLCEIKALEPYLVPLLGLVLDRLADKIRTVQVAATPAYKALADMCNPNAIASVLPVIYENMAYQKKWQTKAGALDLLSGLIKSRPTLLAPRVPDMIPLVSECMWDTKDEIKTLARATMNEVCGLIINKDIEEFIPALIDCIAHPEKVPETIHLLGATTFVSAVESPTLAIMVPLLSRAMTERRNTAILRKTALIIDNMCKLVDQPDMARPFLPKLLPGLKKIEDEVSDPECRSVVQRAHATMLKVADAKEDGTFTEKKAEKKDDVPAIIATLKEAIKAHSTFEVDAFAATSIEYIAHMISALVAMKDFEEAEWTPCIVPYLSGFISTVDAEKVCAAAVVKLAGSGEDDFVPEADEEEGEDLCNCKFSLAYGAKILLNQAVLRLKKGHRYGLCGANGSGKSTLMRAISNEQVENFPPPTELKTVYVEHDIDGSQAETKVIDFVADDERIKEMNKTNEQVAATLSSVGFTEAMLNAPVMALSGGWKMKLALARAMLLEAQIMLLDEPTNHLDVVNVAWLENYLNNLKDVTSIIVSHDPSFLDRVCTDILHLDRFKLRRYKGNLSEFVKRVPEAKSYYDLSETLIEFRFPEPGTLEGVKTKERAIVKMTGVSFTYPGFDKKIIDNVSFQCSLSSRVSVVGPNGAGKSTLIKVLTGELEADGGQVWRHPNLRIAYVAQHAFHHIEQHLEKTPNQYIQWRYAFGEDREEASKITKQISEEEEKAMAKIHVIGGRKLQIEDVLRRRKLKQSYEYEVSFVGCSTVDNLWFPRKQLIEEFGLSKKVNEVDAKEAAAAGLVKPLTSKSIEKHLADVGLEAEFATHSHIKGLSGGQKVKLVIGAAMWMNPHMVVLDEPSNYLDRDSLGALATAIKNYGGGVIMVTHNHQFSEALCSEVWKVENGLLIPSGHNWVKGEGASKLEGKEAEDMHDAMGNVIKVDKKVKLSNRELKKKKKLNKKNGVEDDDDEDY
ncbi:hypothetical protein SmJEL517_g04046 [Synchytrium microbalum]|uniref:ABC transporter domain-containing protein n=1 Tax=Synchytrium microbalum TaxID=1806994 RepID=A0A507C4H0_9FUNG|nr:uncharacterized protein SmJEL517_g04046 [Synchytrium microbalum]TPX32896.1 hypothetical protein SmJEL517_g04046 [Synchytrium microbalum]